MSPDPPTLGGRVRRLARGLRAVVSWQAYWLPVALPLALLAQVGLLGLGPALAERQRLLQEEVTVTERYRSAKEALRRDEATLAAWSDPVFRERQARVRGDGRAASPAR